MVLALLTLAVLTSATLVIQPGPVEGWLAGVQTTAAPATSEPVAPEPIPTPVLAAADAEQGVTPTSARLKAVVDPLVKAPALGSRVRVSIVDGLTGDALYEREAGVPTTPASTTKLVTAATVLSARGPAYRLSTRAVAGAKPGEVVLVGGGDPTLAVGPKSQFPGAARLDKLAAQVKKALGDTEPTSVVIDTSLFTGPELGKGWNQGMISEGQTARVQALMTNAGRIKPVHNEVGGDPRFTDPALAAGKAFAKQLGVTAKVKRGKAPAGAAELGAVQSPPLVHLVDWMLQQSDNVLAEALGRQVALAADQPASFDGAGDAMTAELSELGLPGDETILYDASGLSRFNGISPALLTRLLATAADGQKPVLGSMFGGLPVAGWSGTLRTRFAASGPNKAGQGTVRAKTGSLDKVNTMAGVLVTKDGRLLAFAILADDTGATADARLALDKFAAKLVACGC